MVDDTSEVTEKLESNNVYSVQIGVGEAAVAALSSEQDEVDQVLPDLVVTHFVAEAGPFEPGQQVPISLSVTNVGEADAASRVKYYISRDTSYDSFDRYAGYDRVGVLAVGDESAESAKPRIRADMSGGTWHILAVVDANGDVDESDEAANVFAVAVIVDTDNPEAELADLSVESVTIDDQVVVSGSKVELSASLVNRGVVNASATRAKFYLSDDGIFDGPDIYLDYRDVGALMVGATTALEASLRIPHGTEDGTWQLLTVLDVAGDVEERFETNNVVPTEIIVDPAGAADASFPGRMPGLHHHR